MLEKVPYDVFLLIASHLDLLDIHSISLTCKILSEYSLTRPVYRRQANNLLARCRPLPLKGFAQLAELDTIDLIRAVNKARRNEIAWQHRGPHPLQGKQTWGTNPKCNYLDFKDHLVAKDVHAWYRTMRLALVDDEVDWLSTITTRYLLCSTKRGYIVCQNLESGEREGIWSLGEKWELWKCKVDFEMRKACIVMAEQTSDPFDEEQEMVWAISEVTFPKHNDVLSPRPGVDISPKLLQRIRFTTRGIALNVFILDAPRRRLAVLILLNQEEDQGNFHGKLGLYLLPDWDRPGYIFVDTDLQANVTSNWTCILLEKTDILVIHHEEASAAYQHVYPFDVLSPHLQSTAYNSPEVRGIVPPALTLKRDFVFLTNNTWVPDSHSQPSSPLANPITTLTDGPSSATVFTLSTLNPFPVPNWYPEASHFVRQWWPKFADEPSQRASCAVLLLGNHDLLTHKTTYVLAQYYFTVPMNDVELASVLTTGEKGRLLEGEPLKLWYIHTNFEICNVPESIGGGEVEQRPLIAVDFGHAVWVEYKHDDTAEKCLRFATFPAFDEVGGEGLVRTLELPPELDLNTVQSINFDQSQCAAILSVTDGQIFILCYE